MILIFEPRPPLVHWCALAGKTRTGDISPVEPGTCAEVIQRASVLGALDCVAYFVPHGGQEFTASVQAVDRDTLPALRRVVPHMPEHVEITCQLVEQSVELLPQARHLLLCDTGFFAELPPASSEYAIPRQLRRQGLRRYGGYGLAHDWAWREVRGRAGPRLSRLVSVYLGNQSNVAAIRNGAPVETSIGFTGVEGIPSATSCGDIDPTIPLHLRSSGMSFAEINRLLSRESGFAGLVGRPCDLYEVLAAKDDDTAAARELFRASVIKQVGAAMAILGGIDALAFMARAPQKCAAFMREISEAVTCLPVGSSWQKGGENSDVLPSQVHVLTFDSTTVMARLAADFRI